MAEQCPRNEWIMQLEDYHTYLRSFFICSFMEDKIDMSYLYISQTINEVKETDTRCGITNENRSNSSENKATEVSSPGQNDSENSRGIEVGSTEKRRLLVISRGQETQKVDTREVDMSDIQKENIPPKHNDEATDIFYVGKQFASFFYLRQAMNDLAQNMALN